MPHILVFLSVTVRYPFRNSFNSPLSRVSVLEKPALEGGGGILKSISGRGTGMGTVSGAVLELDSTSSKVTEQVVAKQG